MTQPINLNKQRKARTRAEAKAQADANAVRFGRTKAQQVLEATRADKARTTLDQHKFEDE